MFYSHKKNNFHHHLIVFKLTVFTFIDCKSQLLFCPVLTFSLVLLHFSTHFSIDIFGAKFHAD